MSSHPLAGVKVLDLTNVLAGPFCCHQLAHLGADVIKVEVPGRGDLARQLGADTGLNDKLMGTSFLAQNAGKRSLTLNLKHTSGKDLLRRIVKACDVLVENFRPGVMDRLGVGYEALSTENPGLIYCAISGYGQDGPLRTLPAYDHIIQGLSGVMSITGSQDTAPYRVGYPMCDTIGGLTAAMAICAALNDKDRDKGAFIDVSMLEATLATMGWVVSNHLIAGIDPTPNGNENPTSAPSGTFETKDAPLNIAANKQEQFETLCDILGREDLLENPDYKTRDLRKQNRFALKAELESALVERPAAEWSERLNSAGVPAGTVLTVPEVLNHPQIRDRGMIGEFSGVPGANRDVRLARIGVKINGDTPSVDTPPPTLGQHSGEVLTEFGLSPEEIEVFRTEGVI